MPVIAHLSDIHLGAHSSRLAESMLADIVDAQPDLVVVSGDLTQRARPAEFVQARQLLDAMPASVLVVPGNHDIPLFDLPRRMVSPTQRFEELISADLDPVVSVPGIVAVGLDSMPSWRWKAGHVSPRQSSIVVDSFDACPAGSWRIVVTHHPILPSRLSRLAGRAALVDACAQAQVAILLSGHTHSPRADVVPLGPHGAGPSALAMVAGTAISRRIRGTANAYGIIELGDSMTDGATIVLRVRAPRRTAWSDRSTTHFRYSSSGVLADSQNT